MRRLSAAVLGAAVVHAGAALAQVQSDWQTQQQERNWQENPVSLPGYPKPGSLLGFDVSAATDFRFSIDSTSISVGSDGVVRYVLVARSPSGAENVSYEGIRCKSAEYRIYATGRRDGTWTKGQDARWRPIRGAAVNWHRALAQDYFCPQGFPIYSAAEGVDALKRGGNPRSSGDSAPASGN